MIYKYEKHLISYQKKEQNLPTYNELYEYVKDVKEKSFRKGILIELLHNQDDLSDNDIHEIMENLNLDEENLHSDENLLNQYRLKEIELSFKLIHDFFYNLTQTYSKKGSEYCNVFILKNRL